MSDEWSEKKKRQRVPAVRGKSTQRLVSPFEEVKETFRLDDDDALKLLLEEIEAHGILCAKRRFEQFAKSIVDAAEDVLGRHVLDRQNQMILKHLCGRTIDECRKLYEQTVELADNEDSSEEDVVKGILFFHMSLGTAAELVCGQVEELLSNA